jgi:hypothetical protein
LLLIGTHSSSSSRSSLCLGQSLKLQKLEELQEQTFKFNLLINICNQVFKKV